MSDDVIKKYNTLKNEIELRKEQNNRLEGKLESQINELKELGFTQEDAEKWEEEATSEYKKLETKISSELNECSKLIG